MTDNMAFQEWASLRLSELLPLDDQSIREIVEYSSSLSNPDAAKHLENLLGDSPEALNFITSFNQKRPAWSKVLTSNAPMDKKVTPVDARPSGTPSAPTNNTNTNTSAYAPPSYPPPSQHATRALRKPHTNAVIRAGEARAKDEQEMQFLLQDLQIKYQIYNPEIEPDHDADYYCNCPIHNFQRIKYRRLGVQDAWSNAVMYPGEKAYNDCPQNMSLINRNPYKFRITSPYGYGSNTWGVSRPQPGYHANWIRSTLKLNNSLNTEAQANVDKREPRFNIWDNDDLDTTMAKLTMNDGKPKSTHSEADAKSSRRSGFRKSFGIKSAKERAMGKLEKEVNETNKLRDLILAEEDGRWPDAEWREVVAAYQSKVGMLKHITDLRARKPLQYSHLLRAGYFEPIPVAWAGAASNPLKFSIEASAGWRGITPAWRGYEDTAEERLYWVLNHRDGGLGPRMKPDFISAMDMARKRMESAVEPPPAYFSSDDVCHVQHTSTGYSKQVLPPPFRPHDQPEAATDDTMILLDVSGSMDFDPIRPIYNQYLITGYTRSTQPRNKDVAKSIIHRFTDAMSNHSQNFLGYDLVTFSSKANYIGTINHRNFDRMWSTVKISGGTRVMTGWQKVKDLHFEKHSASATHHPIYGWQAGPDTPTLRLLLLLDGEATDMDEFELDLLACSWAHVTIFLIGVDGCPHHHRHANELQRISDVNPHVSFVDAQGNTPERYVTHELLKRHLGYDVSMEEFVRLEELPPYTE